MVLNDLEQKYKNNYHNLPQNTTLLISFTTLTDNQDKTCFEHTKAYLTNC